MTPETKAKEIVDRYEGLYNRTWEDYSGDWNDQPLQRDTAKACAIIHVNGIIDALDMPGVDFPDEITIGIPNERKLIGGRKFWKDVLNEIEKL